MVNHVLRCKPDSSKYLVPARLDLALAEYEAFVAPVPKLEIKCQEAFLGANISSW